MAPEFHCERAVDVAQSVVQLGRQPIIQAHYKERETDKTLVIKILSWPSTVGYEWDVDRCGNHTLIPLGLRALRYCKGMCLLLETKARTDVPLKTSRQKMDPSKVLYRCSLVNCHQPDDILVEGEWNAKPSAALRDIHVKVRQEDTGDNGRAFFGLFTPCIRLLGCLIYEETLKSKGEFKLASDGLRLKGDLHLYPDEAYPQLVMEAADRGGFGLISHTPGHILVADGDQEDQNIVNKKTSRKKKIINTQVKQRKRARDELISAPQSSTLPLRPAAAAASKRLRELRKEEEEEEEDGDDKSSVYDMDLSAQEENLEWIQPVPLANPVSSSSSSSAAVIEPEVVMDCCDDGCFFKKEDLECLFSQRTDVEDYDSSEQHADGVLFEADYGKFPLEEYTEHYKIVQEQETLMAVSVVASVSLKRSGSIELVSKQPNFDDFDQSDWQD